MPHSAPTSTVLPPDSRISFPLDGPPVERTAAEALCRLFGLAPPRPSASPDGTVAVGLAAGAWPVTPAGPLPSDHPWIWLHLPAAGRGRIAASEPALLYAAVHLLHDGLTDAQHATLEKGLVLPATFSWNRPLYDTVLTQVGRTVRDFDAETYVERLARSGFTHLEVNGLASHTPHEPGVPGEYYAPFYSYGPGLLQFVDSSITRGLYDPSYLAANLNHLKRLAALGRRYGLRPGLLCFEPRTLPEAFFVRYPTLRGARVDHPFRSRLPRYTLAQDHPVAQAHYRELMERLLEAVPDLAYLSVWTNDSGAGFEHTASLYVGRNGGPYLIREWRSHEKIAEAAGRSALRWLHLMREAAAATNPDFEVLLRIEPFKVEHEVLVEGMGNGVGYEAPSLLVRGYHLPYRHPRYAEQESAAGTIYHTDMDPSETTHLAGCRTQGFEPKLTYAAGSSFNLEPLLGTPFPHLLHRKLMALRASDFRCISAIGGLLHLDKTPYWPHPEIIRLVQFTPERPLDDLLNALATRWAGTDHAADLADLWRRLDEAVSYLPLIPLYSNFGFVWLRTWVRPLVPDLEAIPRPERRYFEQFLVSTANNPNINDLGKDVLFELINAASGRSMADAFDTEVAPRLAEAFAHTDTLVEATDGAAVFVDLRDRIRALQCWATTQRNTCAWVAGVYGFLAAETDADRDAHEAYLQDMIDLDLQNTRHLADLWREAPTEVFLISGAGETSFVYGENFGDLLQRKIRLTEQYRNHKPYIDPDIIWRLE